ncbi:ComEC/Rec2 family competence protein [Spirochaeta africana]|uniref:Putative hydrolase (Metallo-beta-lactamase superfamily) n=1 Tax=Spirochaeta africana (strain ATCC 700263 / DSM 8902 / Z-7692) TaxID=889378 RepID=H9UH31_SPIAZ|nr:ComEC/Rec2 family competence protein [Spirochaeta africana]AFG36824.1 putative hydrolase (metallo-beta-lactamase superfamily) [Spirochaeta africana DSM 8902]
MGKRMRVCRAVLLAVLLLGVLPLAAAAGGLRLHVVDVGQGGGMVLETAEAVVLFDAGQYGDMAEYLLAAGITRVDLAIASHGHADHIGGFPAVLQAVPVEQVWYNGQTHTTLTFERFVDAVLDAQTGYHEPSRGESVELGELRLTVLHPTGSAADYAGHLHDQNIVVLAEFRDFRVLLTGDAEIATELELADAGLLQPVTVLQLGHHGSRTSSSPQLLQAVEPEIVVYQAGQDNRYGHPHPEVITRVRELTSARILGTDTHGTIVLHSDGQETSIVTEREAAP